MRRVWLPPVLLTTLSMGCRACLGADLWKPTHFTEQGGAAVFGAVCAACHMRDGHGAEGAGPLPVAR